SEHAHLDIDPRCGQRLDLLFDRGADGDRVLVGHEPQAHFRRSPSRDDRLLALAGEAADEAVGIQRWAAAGALERQKAGFALEGPSARSFQERIDVPLVLAFPYRELFGAGRFDVVVKAGHGDVPIPALELADDA